MNTLARYAFVALVLVAGVVGLSLCADALGAECAHLCCSGADRSKPLVRTVVQMHRALASAVTSAAPHVAGTLQVARTTLDSLSLAPPSLQASALRI